MLKMAKLAPMLKETVKDVRVGGHNGSDDGKLHAMCTLPPKGWERA
jgi:hypothetical protein